MAPAVKAVIIDDSAVVRTVLARELTRLGLEVVGVASDPYVGRDLIVTRSPDVVTLDLEMPRMDGLTFLEKLMTYHPMPVVLLSSLTPAGSDNALRALELGAVGVFEKPKGGVDGLPAETLRRLAELLKEAARARPRRLARQTPPPTQSRAKRIAFERTSDKVVALGASTGGVEALSELIEALPASHPGLLVVQHMPPIFTRNFAERLDRRCAMRVKEAQDGDFVSDGVALLAPGNFHLVLKRSGGHYRVNCINGPPVHHMRPSVDVLFKSVAQAAGPNAVGALLTGMGKDGAQGLLEMRQAGAMTFAQDEASSVVWGMPKEAVALGAAGQVLSLEKIAPAVQAAVSRLKSGVAGA